MSVISDILYSPAAESGIVENLEVVAEAADGLSKLRGAVLELAIRGLLVSHNALEGTAATLLASMGPGIGPSRSLSKPDAMFEIPGTWAWTRMGSVCSYIQRGKSPKYVESSAVAVISQKCVQWEGFLIERARFIDPKTLENYAEDRLLRAGDLLWNSTGHGTVGRIAVYSADPRYEKVVADSHVTVVRPKIDPKYLWCWIASPTVQSRIDGMVSGTTKQTELATSTVIAHPIPLPPLAEQKRIVTRVDQLMALIDDLEAKHTKKRDLSTRFTKASLAALTTAGFPEAFDIAWQRVVENFPTIINNAEKADDIRRHVLRLAVRGRLVASQGCSASVGDLLERTEQKRGMLIAQRKASKRDDLPPVSSDEKSFVIPDHWRWTRLGVASICRDGQRIPISKEDRATRRGPYDYYGASGVIDTIDKYIFDETLLLVGEDGANLLSRSTPIAFLAAGHYWVNNHAHVLDGADVGTLRYLALYLNAVDLAPYVTGTAQPKMNQAKMNMIPIALPPPEEQLLIVAKVDHLIKLCDDLEAALRHAEDRASKLVEAVVQELVA